MNDVMYRPVVFVGGPKDGLTGSLREPGTVMVFPVRGVVGTDYLEYELERDERGNVVLDGQHARMVFRP